MLVSRRILILVLFLVGCTNTPVTTPQSENTTVAANPTSAEPPTEQAATEIPRIENTIPAAESVQTAQIQEYSVPPGKHPHDVAPAPDGSVWYTAQISGALG